MKQINKEISKLFFHLINEKIDPEIKKRIYNVLLWCSTECSDDQNFNWQKNKHFGQRYWSYEALKIFIRSKKVTNQGLIHEHAIPKLVLIDLILICKNEREILGILNKYSIAVIITQDEHKNLNKKYRTTIPQNENKLSKSNIFERYHKCKIKICDFKSSKSKKNEEALLKLKKTKDISKYIIS